METTYYTNDAVALLKELIAIPSVSRDEKRAADKLAEYLNDWDLPHGREGNNLWVGCPDWDNNRPTIMLNAHIDTVKPVSSWTRDPFTPSQEGEQILVWDPTTVVVVWWPRFRPIASCSIVPDTITSCGWPLPKRRSPAPTVSAVSCPFCRR